LDHSEEDRHGRYRGSDDARGHRAGRVATRRAVDLGASVADDLDTGEDSLRVLRDPEGNEFCLVLGSPGEP
jgi:hypothetical protein